ncbi:MAG: aminotransferase class III-fold pyridoxal phosphate-dependent enzyme, partial [Clostridia bacterium]|nr:aminotransferase class III-fold pyridoxal phosphate-dependent enzyme [Deltaproteobacteria bacterium]
MTSSASRIVWRPYTQEKLVGCSPRISRAAGAYLFDERGTPFFDGIASWWLTTHGHCHPVIIDAVSAQAARLDQ